MLRTDPHLPHLRRRPVAHRVDRPQLVGVAARRERAFERPGALLDLAPHRRDVTFRDEADVHGRAFGDREAYLHARVEAGHGEAADRRCGRVGGSAAGRRHCRGRRRRGSRRRGGLTAHDVDRPRHAGMDLADEREAAGLGELQLRRRVPRRVVRATRLVEPGVAEQDVVEALRVGPGHGVPDLDRNRVRAPEEVPSGDRDVGRRARRGAAAAGRVARDHSGRRGRGRREHERRQAPRTSRH